MTDRWTPGSAVRRIRSRIPGWVSSGMVPVADQALVSAVNFLTGIVVARAVGVAGFGAFSLAWMVVLFVANLQYALVSAPMMSIGPKQDPAGTGHYFGAVFLQQGGFALLSMLAVAAGAATIAATVPSWGIDDLLAPMTAATAAYQTQDFLRRYFFTRGRAATALLIDGIGYAGQIAGLVAAAYWLELTAANALWITAAAFAVAAAMGGALTGPLSWRSGQFGAVLQRHWRFAGWLGVSSLLQWTTAHLYFFVAGALFGATAVGALRAANTLLGLTNVLRLALHNVAPVRAAEHFARDGSAALARYVARIGRIGGWATAAIVLVLAAAPEFWLGILFGIEFAPYGWLVRWYAAAYFLMFVMVVLSAALRATERTRVIFLAHLAAAIVLAVTMQPLFDRFGITGAAIGAVLVQTVTVAVLAAGYRRSLRQSTTPTLAG